MHEMEDVTISARVDKPLAVGDGCGVRIVPHFNTNAYMHEQSTMGLGVRIVAGNT